MTYMSKDMIVSKYRPLVAALPDMSREALAAIDAGLYAEGGFSDVTVLDVVRRTGFRLQQVKGCISHLCREGLLNTEGNPNSGEMLLYPTYWLHDSLGVEVRLAALV